MISYKEILTEIKKLKLDVEDYNNDQINLQKDIKKIKNISKQKHIKNS